MTTTPWKYQEEEIRHAMTGAIGAKTPQGDIVYGSLAEKYLTPTAPLRVEDPPSPIGPAQKIIDTTSPQAQLAALETKRQEELAKIETEKTEVKEERKSLTDQLKGFFTGVKPTQTIIDEQMKAFGVTEQMEQQRTILSEISSLHERATGLVEQRDAAIGVLGEQAIATPFISGQQARIAENYDRRISSMSALIGAKSAYVEAIAGNISQARAFIGDIVNAYTYDTQLELSKMTLFLDLNRDEISMLDTEYKNVLSESQRYLENQLAEEKAEREAIMNLMIQYPTSGVGLNDTIEEAITKTQQWLGIQPDADIKQLMAQYPMAGITTKDTFTEAITKIAQTTRPEQPQIFGGETGGYTEQYFNPKTNQWEYRPVRAGIGWAPDRSGGEADVVGISFSDILQDEINAGGSPAAAARVAASVSTAMGIPVTQKQLDIWTEQASKMKPIIPEQIPTPVQTKTGKDIMGKPYTGIGTPKSEIRVGGTKISNLNIGKTGVGIGTSQESEFFINLFR